LAGPLLAIAFTIAANVSPEPRPIVSTIVPGRARRSALLNEAKLFLGGLQGLFSYLDEVRAGVQLSEDAQMRPEHLDVPLNGLR
jgi:hypothetical protein